MKNSIKFIAGAVTGATVYLTVNYFWGQYAAHAAIVGLILAATAYNFYEKKIVSSS